MNLQNPSQSGGQTRPDPDLKIAAVSDALRQWREKSVQLVLRFLAIVGIVGVPALIFVVQGRMIGIYLAAYGVILLLAFWKRVPYFVKAMVLLTLFYGLGLVSFVEFARGGAGIIFLLAFVVMAMLLLGHVVGLGALALSLFSIVACGWAFSTGRWIVSTEALYSNTTFSMWLSVALVFLLLGGLLLRFQATLFASLEVVLYDMHQLTRQVNAARTELERRVLERTRDLERRARYLQATSDVAHEATQMVADSQALLQHVVNLVSEQFGFYHAGIFLLDRTGEWAELQAASSAGGQRMLARQHRLRIGEQGTVGYVAAQGVPRVVSDVTDDMVFYNNPDLPETRSAVSLPLHARGEIIGVLDVQSKEVAAFSDEDAEVLQALADQVAIAISNAYLFQQVQQSAEAERRTRGELAREAWRELLRTEPNMGFLSDPHGTTPVSGDEWDAEMIEALNTGVPVKGEEAVALALPIRSRGQVVGVIDAHLPAETREWTSEQVSLLEALAAQVGTALESAQLYRETQRRATRERLTREITDALQRAVDMESLMRIAAEELNRNLRGSRAYVRLDVTSPETGAEQTLEGDEDATTE